jgi:pseudouridine synthase
MHKPAGTVTTRSDERGRKTVYDLLPEHTPWVFPVGRLDKDTSGLLLFTNDTRFGERITRPESRVSKTYVAQIDRPIETSHRKLMEGGMETESGERFLPATVVPDRQRMKCEVTIQEGRNRQVRKMFKHFGYEVVALHRTRIGPLALGELRPGDVRSLHPSEIEALSLLERATRP